MQPFFDLTLAGNVDPDIAAPVSEVALARYQQALGGLVAFQRRHRLQLQHVNELDAACILYKRHVTLTRSQISYLIAS